MRTDGPAPDGGPRIAVDAADDTRPVTRDWLLGAPDPDAAPGGRDAAPPARPTTGAPRRFDRTPADDSTVAIAPQEDDETDDPRRGPDRGGRRRRHRHPRRPAARATSRPRTVRAGRGGAAARVLVPAGAIAVLAAAYGVDLLASSGDIPRSTVVAGVDIGGLSPAAAASALEEKLAPRVQADHTVVADDVESPLSPATAGHHARRRRHRRRRRRPAAEPVDPAGRPCSATARCAPVITGDETALDAQIETHRRAGRPRPGGRDDHHRRHDAARRRPRGRPHARPRGLRRGDHRRPRRGRRPRRPRSSCPSTSPRCTWTRPRPSACSTRPSRPPCRRR